MHDKWINLNSSAAIIDKYWENQANFLNVDLSNKIRAIITSEKLTIDSVQKLVIMYTIHHSYDDILLIAQHQSSQIKHKQTIQTILSQSFKYSDKNVDDYLVLMKYLCENKIVVKSDFNDSFFMT